VAAAFLPSTVLTVSGSKGLTRSDSQPDLKDWGSPENYSLQPSVYYIEANHAYNPERSNNPLKPTRTWMEI